MGGPETFCLFRGGPLYLLPGTARLRAGRAGILRWLLVYLLVGWLPPLLLGLTSQLHAGDLVSLHTRYLIALPLLFGGELFLEQRVRRALLVFREAGLVRGTDVERFHGILARAERMRDSRVAAVVMLALAVAAPLIAILIGHEGRRFTVADGWRTYVSLPLYRLVILHWLWRWLIWGVLLARLSRLDLDLVPTHPDRAAGLGFLELPAVAFVPFLLAASASISGDVGSYVIAHHGARANQLIAVAMAFGALVAMVVVLPLLPFCPALVRARARGLYEMGTFAEHHDGLFAAKWLRGSTADPLGAPDISSLADVGPSYERIVQTRRIPLSRHSVVVLLVVSASPVLPVLPTQIPVTEMIKRILGTLVG